MRLDAFGVLRRGAEILPFFLEWERRAVRPITMAARLAPYMRYYSTRRPLDDHGTPPTILVVFDDDLAPPTSCGWRERRWTGRGGGAAVGIPQGGIGTVGAAGPGLATPDGLEPDKALSVSNSTVPDPQ